MSIAYLREIEREKEREESEEYKQAMRESAIVWRLERWWDDLKSGDPERVEHVRSSVEDDPAVTWRAVLALVGKHSGDDLALGRAVREVYEKELEAMAIYYQEERS